jgi:NitT/TauT family transport system substrate-binding protein
VVHSWFKTLDYIDDNNTDSMKRMAKRLRVTDTEVKAMMKGIYIPGREENVAILGGNSPSIIPAANRLSKIMLAEGLLTRPVTLSGSIDPEFTGCYQ